MCMMSNNALETTHATELLRTHLLTARNRMKAQADNHITNHEYQVDDQVLLKHKPYAQTSVINAISQIGLKFSVPFKILERIGAAAYKIGVAKWFTSSSCITCLVAQELYC